MDKDFIRRIILYLTYILYFHLSSIQRVSYIRIIQVRTNQQSHLGLYCCVDSTFFSPIHVLELFMILFIFSFSAYVKDYGVRGSRTLASKTIHALNILVCRAYCHKIIKLSATLPVLARYVSSKDDFTLIIK